MPNPIPEWDLARRLVKFVGTRQMTKMQTTMRETSRTLGVGRQRIIQLLEEKNIEYKILGHPKRKSEDLLLIGDITMGMAADTGLSRVNLHRTFEELSTSVDFKPTEQARRVKRKEREKILVKEFWKGE